MTSTSMADNGKVPLGLLIRQLLNAVIARYMLIPRYGVTWFRLYVFACIVLAAVSAVGWRTINSVLITLSISSLLFIAIWWFQFISGVHVLAPTSALRLVPRYRQALIVLVVALWLMTSMLLTTFFIFHEWFFVSVLAFMFATSLSTEKERLLAALLILLLIVLAIFFGYNNDMLVVFRQNDDLAFKIESGITLWATFAGILALLGATFTQPLVAIIIWVVWIGAMLFSAPIFGMSFGDLLDIIYNASTRAFTNLIAALMLFGLMMYGLISKSLDHRLLSAGSGNKAGVLTLSDNFSWRKKSLWQLLPGFDYFLARALKRPFSFQSMLTFMFGRLVHWTSALWCGVLLGFMLSANSIFRPRPSHSYDSVEKILAESNIFMFAFFYTMGVMFSMAQFTLATYGQRRKEHQLLSIAAAWPGERQYRQYLLLHFIKYALASVALGSIFITANMVLSGVPSNWMPSLFWYPFVVVVSAALSILIVLLKPGELFTTNKLTRDGFFLFALVYLPPMAILALKTTSVSAIFVLESIAIIYCIVLIVRIRRFLNSDKKIFSVD
jgi:hypothetical protein